MKKNFALAVALTIALSSTAPAFAAYTRDGGGRDRDLSPIQRVIKIIKKLFTPIAQEDADLGGPHP